MVLITLRHVIVFQSESIFWKNHEFIVH